MDGIGNNFNGLAENPTWRRGANPPRHTEQRPHPPVRNPPRENLRLAMACSRSSPHATPIRCLRACRSNSYLYIAVHSQEIVCGEIPSLAHHIIDKY